MATNLFTVPVRYDADAVSLMQVGELVTRLQLIVTIVEGQPVVGVIVTPAEKEKRRGHR